MKEFLFYPRQRSWSFLENKEERIEVEIETKEIEETETIKETKPKKVKLLQNKKKRKWALSGK